MKRFREVILFGAALGLLVGCTGGSRKVSDCGSCLQQTSSGDHEYCVMGEPSQLYCATPCVTHADCVLDHWCVPVADQGTEWESVDRAGWIRWVCMPERFYANKSRAVSVQACDTCTQFYAGTTCLADDATSQFFCSDTCTTSSACLTNCCADTGDGKFCAPPDYCALSVVTGCDLCTASYSGDKTSCIQNPTNTAQKMCAKPCASSDSCPFGYFCSVFINARTTTTEYINVCVPSTGKKDVTPWPTNCANVCPTDTECIQVTDDANPGTIRYYCSEPCTGDAECVTGCCEPETIKGLRYCAPYDYCLPGKKK